MFSFTSLRHEIFIKIPQLKAGTANVHGYSVVVDGVVDELAGRCREDAELFEAIGACDSCATAYPMMEQVMADQDKRPGWINDNLSSIYRRVLFVLFPDRFGFERSGWDW